MLSTTIRRCVTIAAALLLVHGVSRIAAAQPAAATARFSATTAGLSAGTPVNVSIDVLRWSSDEEADKLVAAFKEKGDKWAEALEPASAVGYIWAATASLGYSVKLARQLMLPDGGTRIILAVYPALGSWDRPAWKAAGAQATELPFTVIELRVNKAGVGEGKASLAAKPVIDDTAKAVALENYATAPVLLRGVKRGSQGSAAPPATPARKPPAPAPAAAGAKSAPK
jgi:hypothetical protein